MGAVLGLQPATQASSPREQASLESEDPASIAVYVSGWVVHPGVVKIPPGSLTADAVAAAGGARPGALLDQINLARPVADGEQVDVPAAGEPFEGANASDGLVDINLADEATLQTLPGVGPVLAGRIVAHRDEIGRFESVEDLLDVPGIGETRLASLRDLIRPP